MERKTTILCSEFRVLKSAAERGRRYEQFGSCRSLEAGYAGIDFGSLGGSNSLESLGRIWKSEGLEWSWKIKKPG